MNNYHTRQLGIVNPNLLNISITVIGAGGIGSWATLALAKMGCSRLTVWDGDKVAPENIGSQLYGEKHIGRPKPEALASIISDLAVITIAPVNQVWNGQPLNSSIVIVAVDNMKTRKTIWNKIKLTQTVQWYIEARMAQELIRLYTIKMTDQEGHALYEKTLYDDKKTDPIPCTERAVVYNTLACGSLITRQVKDIATDQMDSWPWEVIFDLSTLIIIERGRP